jgi:Putative zinc-finger
MTNPSSAGQGPAAGPGWHASPDLLAGYAAGEVGGAAAWSVEAHLDACAQCRSALSPHADPERLARNRSVLLVRAATGDGGRVSSLLRRCGVPGYLLTLLAATPALRRSWLLSVAGVLALVTGEAALARYGWGGTAAGRHPGQEILVPFLLAAPLLALAGVAAAFLPVFDPAWRLAVAAPFSGFTLLLVRTVCALATAMIPAACAAFAMPGPGWLPAAFLLPSLAVCAVALAAVTVTGPLPAAVAAGAAWVLPVLLLAGAHLPLAAVGWHGQAAAAGVLLAAAAVLLARRDRFELGWMR